MFVFINQPPEPSLRGELRGAEGWDVVWNRPSSKSCVSCLVAQDWIGVAWEQLKSRGKACSRSEEL